MAVVACTSGDGGPELPTVQLTCTLLKGGPVASTGVALTRVPLPFLDFDSCQPTLAFGGSGFLSDMMVSVCELRGGACEEIYLDKMIVEEIILMICIWY